MTSQKPNPNRQGKRKPGNVLISYSGPSAMRAQLMKIAQDRGEESMSAMLRKVGAAFIRRHYAGRKARNA
jgi:hypothetical protein